MTKVELIGRKENKRKHRKSYKKNEFEKSESNIEKEKAIMTKLNLFLKALICILFFNII